MKTKYPEGVFTSEQRYELGKLIMSVAYENIRQYILRYGDNFENNVDDGFVIKLSDQLCLIQRHVTTVFDTSCRMIVTDGSESDNPALATFINTLYAMYHSMPVIYL